MAGDRKCNIMEQSIELRHPTASAKSLAGLMPGVRRIEAEVLERKDAAISDFKGVCSG
jgi:hypothetical protein